jgi:hypothetical protein
MFACALHDANRLHLLNFLWSGAETKDAQQFKDKFSSCFTSARLRFVDARTGFALEDRPDAARRAKIFQALMKSSKWMETRARRSE